MKKQILFLLFFLISVSSIQAQKITPLEKKVFLILSKNVKKEQLVYLAYCLNIPLESATEKTISDKLIETANSYELAQKFYTNEKQFYIHDDGIINPSILFGDFEELAINKVERDKLLEIFNIAPAYPTKTLEDIKQKVYNYLVWSNKQVLLSNNITIDATIEKQLKEDCKFIIDSGKITSEIQQKYYPEISYKSSDKAAFLNPSIYPPMAHLLNFNDEYILVNSYPTINFELNKCGCDTVYLKPEIVASYKDGYYAFQTFIYKNIKYPLSDASAGISGDVFVKVYINKVGKICSTEIEKSVSAGIDNEALRVFNLLNNFFPAKNNGQDVCSSFTLPVHFILH